jgi:hypothetical protein
MDVDRLAGPSCLGLGATAAGVHTPGVSAAVDMPVSAGAALAA